MTCDCYGEVKKKLVTHFTEKAPAGSTPVEVTVEGYLFGLTDSGVSHASSNTVKVAYQAPKKAGGMKNVKISTFVRATFCPFCGVRYQPLEPEALEPGEAAANG